MDDFNSFKAGWRYGFQAARWPENVHGPCSKPPTTVDEAWRDWCELPDPDAGKERCPYCTTGYITLRNGKYGKFHGCSRFPQCRWTRNFEDDYDWEDNYWEPSG